MGIRTKLFSCLTAVTLAAGLVPAGAPAALAADASATGGQDVAAADMNVQPLGYDGFTDVVGDEWFAIDDVLGYAVAHDLMTGYPDGRFDPYANVTRGQVAVVLFRMAGEPEGAAADPFEDVDYSQYYGPAITWARSMGVISGFQDADGAYRTFRPDDAVSREQLAAMLGNYARQIKGIVTDTDGQLLSSMPDAASVDGWAVESVGWAMDAGLISGVVEPDASYVRPLDTAQRSAMAKMASALHRDVLPPDIDPQAKPEVDYKDDVEHVQSPNLVQNVDGSVTLPSSDVPDSVQPGDVVVATKDGGVDGAAVRVNDVSRSGDSATISGTTPELSEVFDRLKTEGVGGKVESVTPEPGVELVESGVQTMADDGSYDLGTFKFKVKNKAEDGELEVSAKPQLEYKIDAGFGKVNQVYETFGADFEVSGSYVKGFEGDQKLASFHISTNAPGVTIEIALWLDASAEGKMSVAFKDDFKHGFNYKNGHANLINEHDPNFSVAPSFEVKAGADVTGSIDTFKKAIVDLSLGGGVKGAPGDPVKRSNGMVCQDLAVSLFAAVEVGKHDSLIADWGWSWEKELADKPLVTEHYENGKKVPKCTWQDPDDLGYGLFKQLPSTFTFTSGAGGWATTIDLYTSGEFTGSYQDSNMGDTGDGYPKGTVYICNFYGKFTEPKKADDHTYAMNLEKLVPDQPAGVTYYQDGIRYITADPYGFDKAKGMLVFLDGAPKDKLPQGFIDWTIGWGDVFPGGVLDGYGIYNVEGQMGFYAKAK